MATITAATKVARTKKANTQDAKETKINLNFTIDCSKPVEDKVFNTSNFA